MSRRFLHIDVHTLNSLGLDAERVERKGVIYHGTYYYHESRKGDMVSFASEDYLPRNRKSIDRLPDIMNFSTAREVYLHCRTQPYPCFYRGMKVMTSTDTYWSCMWDDYVEDEYLYVGPHVFHRDVGDVNILKALQAIDAWNADPKILLKNLGVNAACRRSVVLQQFVAANATDPVELYKILNREDGVMMFYHPVKDKYVEQADSLVGIILCQQGWRPSDSSHSWKTIPAPKVLGDNYINYFD